jgi:hypothetical protein
MPRYYFDTHDDDRFVPDNEGVEGSKKQKRKPSRLCPTWLVTHSPAAIGATS